jgi:hypothetical protein
MKFINIYKDAAGQEFSEGEVLTSWEDAIQDYLNYNTVRGNRYVCTFTDAGRREITPDDVAEYKQHVEAEEQHVIYLRSPRLTDRI